MKVNVLVTLVSLCVITIKSSIAFAGSVPSIDSIDAPTGIKNGVTITIKGSNFTDKANAKPLFFWRASDGQEPTKYGRKTTWDTPFYGEPNTDVVAKNSTQSFRYDHSGDNAALGAVGFASPTLYEYRKTYEAFDATKSIAIRARIATIVGVFKVGQVVKGQTSGATGVIQSINLTSLPASLQFAQTGGTINNATPTDFVFGEIMVSDTGKAINAEGDLKYPTGTFRTFNFKTIRIWNMSQQTDIYTGVQGALGKKAYAVIPENTDSTYYGTNIYQLPFEWKVEDFYYKASTIDVADGIFDYRLNNIKSYDNPFKSRTSAKPNMYDKVYQSQVSNGAQPNSWMYYDSLYIDDTWHHVVLCASTTWAGCKKAEIQIPVTWTSSQVSVILNFGELDVGAVYLYLVNGNGDANATGYRLCPLCPKWGS